MDYYNQQNQQFYPNQAYNNQQNLYGQQGVYAQGFNQQPISAKYAGTLTAEEDKRAKELINPVFSVKPTEIETIQALCNHRWDNGDAALRPIPGNGDQSIMECQRCHTIVNMGRLYSKEEAKTITDDFVNMQNIIKFCAVGQNPSVIRSLYGNTIPYNAKMAHLYSSVVNDTNTIQMSNISYSENNMPAYQVYNELNAMAFQQPQQQMCNNGYQQQSQMMNMQQGTPINQQTGYYQQPVYDNNGGFQGPNSSMNNQQAQQQMSNNGYPQQQNQVNISAFYNDNQQPQQQMLNNGYPQQQNQMNNQQISNNQQTEPNNITASPVQEKPPVYKSVGKTEVKTGKI